MLYSQISFVVTNSQQCCCPGNIFYVKQKQVNSQYSSIKTNKQTPWSESASELYRPSNRCLSAKWLPTCADRGCHVVSVTDPFGRILDFLGRSRYNNKNSRLHIVNQRRACGLCHILYLFLSRSAYNTFIMNKLCLAVCFVSFPNIINAEYLTVIIKIKFVVCVTLCISASPEVHIIHSWWINCVWPFVSYPFQIL
jgi:hypothetical protein